MRIQPEFPPYRVGDPMCRAEQGIYRVLEESDTPGQALYEARIIPHGREVDFAVWLEDVGRFAVEIKGGRYVVDPGTEEWDLLTGRGRYDKPSPVAQVRDASKSIPEAIGERLDRGVCITAVLALPNMEPDEAIAEAAAREGVEAIFGTGRWVERLADLAGPRKIVRPPTAEQIGEEVAVVMPELAPQRAADPNPQVVIQRVDRLHLHMGPGGAEGLIGLTGNR